MTREQKLEEIVRKLMPATRDVLWCALVWNDHNFTSKELLDKANRAALSLRYERGNAVEGMNEFLAQGDSVLKLPEGK